MNFWGSSYRYHKKAKKIIKLQETYRAMGDEELRQQTELFRQRLAKGESLRSLLKRMLLCVKQTLEFSICDHFLFKFWAPLQWNTITSLK
nr:hypothetical protein [Lacticaseibacillus rhamnosus]